VDHINPGDELKSRKLPVLLIRITDDLFALLPLGLLVVPRVQSKCCEPLAFFELTFV
jgi:hypothetical protein